MKISQLHVLGKSCINESRKGGIENQKTTNQRTFLHEFFFFFIIYELFFLSNTYGPKIKSLISQAEKTNQNIMWQASSSFYNFIARIAKGNHSIFILILINLNQRTESTESPQSGSLLLLR